MSGATRMTTQDAPKHNMTSSELWEFAEWYGRFRMAQLQELERYGVFQLWPEYWTLVRKGTVDECVAWLLNEWRKSRGES